MTAIATVGIIIGSSGGVATAQSSNQDEGPQLISEDVGGHDIERQTFWVLESTGQPLTEGGDQSAQFGGYFEQAMDTVHVSKTPPRTASVHGWWRDPHRNYVGKVATTTVKLQLRVGSKWRTVDTGKKVAYSGGGSGRRATARKRCNSSQPRYWRSVVDVDIIGVWDAPNTLTSPSQIIRCAA